MIKFENIPSSFSGYCAHASCPSAQTCLRHQAFLVLPEGLEFPTLLHPRHYPANGETLCAHYRSAEKVTYARGFCKVLKNFPIKTMEAFRSKMISVYTRPRYYRFRSGAVIIDPQEQEAIRQIAAEQGFEGEFFFDAYQQNYLW